MKPLIDYIIENTHILKTGSYDIEYRKDIIGTIEIGDPEILFIRKDNGEPMTYKVPQKDFIEILKAYSSKSNKDTRVKSEHSVISYASLPGLIKVYDENVSRWSWEIPAYVLNDIIKDNKGIL